MHLSCRGASLGGRQALRTQRKKQRAGALNEYREKLQALSRPEKVVRIDLNGKEKKTAKYFFERDKYVYVRSKAEIERLERGAPLAGLAALAARPAITAANAANAANAAPPARERRRRRSEKALRDAYDLSQEELLYMKFVEKIKMKNIFALLNNIKKNKYMGKKQRETILSCIYKYASHNCYGMTKTHFFFFLYVFPQQLKYACRARHYLRSLLDKDQMTLTQCLRLIGETNLFHLNCHLRGHYLRFLLRNAHKISLPQILSLLSTGSYLFAITPDFKTEEEHLDQLLKKKLIQIVKGMERVPLEGDLKWDYLRYMEWCARGENTFLQLLLNELSVHLHRRVFIDNVEVMKRNREHEYLQRVLTLGRYSLHINHLNVLVLGKGEGCFPEKTTNGKTANGETTNGETANGETANGETANGKTTRGKTAKVKVFPSYIAWQGGGGCEAGEEAAHVAQEQKQPCSAHHVYGALPPDNPARTNQAAPKPTRESNTLRNMKVAFSFSDPMEKLKSSRYEELKQVYQINTKVTDRNVKMLLRFVRMVHHHSNASPLEKLLCRDNLPQIVSDLRRERHKPPFGGERMCRTGYKENSPLWRLTRWWASDQEISSPGKRVPLSHNLFGHTNGGTPPRGRLAVLPSEIAPSGEATVLADPKTKQENEGVKRRQSQEESPPNVCHPSNSSPAENLPPPPQPKDPIAHIVSSVYFAAQHDKRYFHKSQLNCLAKCLLYVSDSFVQFVQKEGPLLREAEKTFYEMFSYVMKNLFLVNLPNWFYVFVAVCKFGGAAAGGAAGGAAAAGDTPPRDRMGNLLQIVHTVRAYRYQEVRAIVQEEDTRRCLQIGDPPLPEGRLPAGHTPNYDTLHRIILSKFRIDDGPVSSEEGEAPLVTRGAHHFRKTAKATSPSAEKQNHEVANSAHMITSQSGINFLLTMLSCYLDGVPFQTKRFLIVLYHLNVSIWRDAAVKTHLETRLHRNNRKFRNRYFYVHTGCGGDKPMLNKSLVARVRAACLALRGGPSPRSSGLASRPNYSQPDDQPLDQPDDQPLDQPLDQPPDLYAQMEKLLRRNQHRFTLDDMLTFIATYSLNGLYHSTVYYSISKWLLRHDLASLPDETKIFLFILFSRCPHVYKPLQLHLLHLVFQIGEVSQQSGLPLLCALIHTMITHHHPASSVRVKHVRYVARKFGIIHWPYFFPLELFLQKSAQEIASRRVLTLESATKATCSNGATRRTTANVTTATREKTNPTDLSPKLDALNLEDHLKAMLPHIVKQLEKRSVGGQDPRINTAHGLMLTPPPADLHPLDDTTQRGVLQNCKNFLSYHFVQRHFLVSRGSLYHAILEHFKEGEGKKRFHDSHTHTHTGEKGQ